MTTGRINQISVVSYWTILGNTSSYSIALGSGDPLSTNVVSQHRLVFHLAHTTVLVDNRQASHVRVANAFTPAKHLLH